MIKSIEMEEPKTAQIKKKLKNSNDILKSGQLLSSKKEKLNKLSDIKKPRNELMEMNNEMKKKNWIQLKRKYQNIDQMNTVTFIKLNHLNSIFKKLSLLMKEK